MFSNENQTKQRRIFEALTPEVMSATLKHKILTEWSLLFCQETGWSLVLCLETGWSLVFCLDKRWFLVFCLETGWSVGGRWRKVTEKCLLL